MFRFRPARTLGTLVLLLSGLAAHACTVCNSRTGHQVRAGLFNGHFLHTLAVVAAPFPVFAALLAALQCGMPDLNLPDALIESQPRTLSQPELAL